MLPQGGLFSMTASRVCTISMMVPVTAAGLQTFFQLYVTQGYFKGNTVSPHTR
jgi:hypothetical protein